MSKKIPLFIVLAGGQGQRFAPLVTNKTIFPFMDKPLLFWQLKQLQRVGVKNVLIATNSQNHAYLEKLKKTEHLAPKDQKAVIHYIEALLAKNN